MSARRLLQLCWACVLILPLPFLTAAEPAAVEPTLHRVPMRDGTKLATDVYLPAEGETPFPVLLMRTPYGRSGGSGYARRYGKRGYAVVAQDMRGRGDSQGHHAIIFHNGGWSKRRDGHDTLDWIALQPWCNGNVATVGGSAVGITQNMLAPGAPDVLKGQVVFVAFSDMYGQSAYQGGVWRKSLLEGWLTATNMFDVNVKTFRAHPNDDDFWAEMNAAAQAHRVNAPGAFIGGWYDIFLQGTINSFVATQHRGRPNAKGKCRLVIAPIAHGGFGELKYPPNARFPKAADESRLLDYWLKGESNGVADDKPVHYYVMGDPTDENAPGNFWRQADDWPPPARNTPFYFHPESKLTRGKAPVEATPLLYKYDPNNPVPTVGGQNLLLPKGPMDQRKIESRPDVLLFTSDVLTEPLEVTGRVRAKLYVSSDCPDTDFTVKLTDVYPDGRSMLLTDGILRARHHKSMQRSDLLSPETIYELTVDLWSTSIIFNRGHRLRVAVSSSNAPRFEPNPNTGVNDDGNGKTRIATNTLHLSPKHPSHILLPLFKGSNNKAASSFQE